MALSAVAVFGGIQVSWSYPATHPYAVAHVLLFRGTSTDFSLATQIAVVAGSQFLDRMDDGPTQYYWIQIVSINGTVADPIGPASATPGNAIAQTIERLTGQIDAGVLATALRTEIDKITLNKAALDAAILDRISGDEALSAALVSMQTGIDQSATLIATEITTRTDGQSALADEINTLAALNATNLALIQDEKTARVDADSAFASELTTISASTKANTAAILTEQTARADADSALATSISTVAAATGDNAAAITSETTARTSADAVLAAAITTAQTTMAGNLASVQTTLQSEITTTDGKVTAIGARYTAVVDVNGLVGGFGVYNDGSTVEAGFNVDTFWIGRTSGDKRKPFIISGGVVYIDTAMINSLDAGKITSGQVAAARLSVTTLSNVINGSVGSGERVDINTNVIKVYDASNVLRVKLGNLV